VGTLIAVDGYEVPVFVVELDGGLRVRFDLNDWEQLRCFRGQRVPVRLPGRADVWLIVAEVVELPPVVWVVLVERARLGA
jgi:hypothetical protein